MEINSNDHSQEVVAQLASAALILTRAESAASSPVESFEELMASLDGCEFDGSVEMIAELVEEFSSIARLDVVNFFEQVVFCWVVGCNRVGASDFALQDNFGITALAPLLANASTAILGGAGGDEFALSINGKCKNLRRTDFEAAMRHMGLKDRIIRITLEKMTASQEKWREIITTSALDPEQQQCLASLITTRLSALAPSAKRAN